ncbi:pentapeptide repeat-containing protein [Aliinostoc sp. HNIBRCY26]|uniref:pentapeptide repeat-containing protein n=1 Tax=Aliinostoc sp. HNIBRCY26 TaxID=3418997 RepID=UPI003D03CFD5
MNSKLNDGLRPSVADRILASIPNLYRTYNGLGCQKYQRILASILSLLLWGVVGMTTIVGFSLPASALEYNKEILIEADFSGRDLTDSSFTKANLRQSNFSNSNLQGVSFFAANLESANLEGVNLTNATLDSARLIRTNLTNAVLEGAFAANAKFDGAIIDGADFTDVLLRPDEVKKLCKVAKGTNPTTGRDTRDTLYCP